MNKRQNILFILTDQFRADCIGVMGNKHIYTPYLDELASESAVFMRAYSPSPTCVPARACLITGKYPENTGFYANEFITEWNFHDTMMEQLRNGGYQTINVGKNHFKPQRKALGFEINKLYETGPDENKLYSDYHQWLEHEGKGLINDTAVDYNPNSWVVMPWVHDKSLHPTEWTVTESIRQLKCKDPTRPFYLQCSFHRPHQPLDPPLDLFEYYHGMDLPGPVIGEWAPKFEKDTWSTTPFTARINSEKLKLAKKAYYAQITHIDSQIGKLISFLRKSRQYNDTMIVFTSDHGELLGDHNMFRKGPAMEGSARIPLIIKQAVSGRSQPDPCFKDTPVTLCDIMPTLLESAGIEPAYTMDGTSLMPVLEGNNLEREFVFGENYRDMDPVKDGWCFVADNSSKYVWNSFTGKEFFFDLQKDPNELVNTIDNSRFKDKIDRMRDYLKSRFKNRRNMLAENGELAHPVLMPPYQAPDK
jgi:arylsulfatase A-like enzyme